MDTEQLFKHIAKGTYYNINSDKDLQNDDRFRMKERNKKYSDILDIYTKNINRVLWVKFSNFPYPKWDSYLEKSIL